MYIDTLTKEAIGMCLTDRIPFALFALPGEKKAQFFASPIMNDKCEESVLDIEGEDCFFINFFDNDEPYTPAVAFRMDAETLLKTRVIDIPLQPEPELRPRKSATYRISYHDAFSRIIPRLKKEGGKVVLSRHRTILTLRLPQDVAEDYFSLTDKTFRYLCYTAETGLWLGSTPELLLESDVASGVIRTMALAGTRNCDDSGPWDEKNIYEQSLVRDSIISTLEEAGLTVKAGKTKDRKFVNIKHLCTEITAFGHADIPSLMRELSPTPAVAGFPRDKALDEISLYETHRRNCYGGFVGIRKGEDYHAYVNLRCCFMAPVSHDYKKCGWLCNLYAGGGLVASSVEEDEWNEAEAKTSALARILIGDDGCSGLEGKQLNLELIEFLPSLCNNLPF